jgi:hypothetical protein
MPRAKPNPKLNGTEMAHRVDIERAWRCASLSYQSRVALSLVIGRGLTHEAAAFGMFLDRSTVSEHVERGISRLCAYLAGEGE